MTNFALSRNIE